MSLSDARLEASKIRALIRNGDDSIQAKKRSQLIKLTTVNDVAED
jgi:hypothetical protein